MTPQDVVPSGYRTPGPSRTKANVARVLLDALASQCKAYCILSGYERLPEQFDTGIDFMVNHEDFQRMPQIIEQIGRQTGTSLFQSIDHELTGRAFFLGGISGAALTVVQPDCASDYSHSGRTWLTAREVLAARRMHSNGFYIPSAAHEFIYFLIKRLYQRDFTHDHGYKLHRLYVEDRIECGRMIARFCRGPEGSALVRMASSNDWTRMRESLGAFRESVIRSHKEPYSRKLASMPLQTIHALQGFIRPTGCWIALTGPDGAGKSFILNAVSRQFAPAFRSVRSYHMRPQVVGRKTARPAQATDLPRGLAASVAKIVDLTADYVFGYATRILPEVLRTQLILFDRCFYDLLVDSKRIRYGGPPWLLHAAARICPSPDLVILLDAPPEVLWARKQELPMEEIARQRTAYLELAKRLPSAIVIDASQPAPDVIHDVVVAVTNHLALRTRNRLNLP